MKMIYRVLITLGFVYFSFGVSAHQPDLSSTILAEQVDNKWVLQVRAALTAFEYEVEQNYGKNSYATPEEFQELVIKHVQDNMSIIFNGTNLVLLKNGVVKLGHETSVTFEIVDLPKMIQKLNISNSSFSDISRNQSALIVLKEGFSKDQFILDDSNAHTVNLKVTNSKFELVTPTKVNTQYALLIQCGALIVGTITFLAFRNRQVNTLTPTFLNV